MARFDRSIATAQRLIAKNGKTVVWTQIVNTPDPTKPWENIQTRVDRNVVICLLPLDRQMRETLTFLAGTDVPTGGSMALMGQVPFEPSITDVVTDEGKELTVDTIQVLAPNGQRVLYTVVFKK